MPDIDIEELDRLDALLAKATRLEKLPLYTDTEKSEGEYGSGPNTHTGFDLSLICADGDGPYVGQQRVLFDAHNSTVIMVEEEGPDEDGDITAFDVTSQRWGNLIVAAVNALPALIALARQAKAAPSTAIKPYDPRKPGFASAAAPPSDAQIYGASAPLGDDPDAVTGCADDQIWSNVSAAQFRNAAENVLGLAAGEFVMVPREPTEAMLKASDREWDGRMSARSAGVWQAMLAAAPSTDGQGGESVAVGEGAEPAAERGVEHGVR